MTPQERELVTELFDRLATLENTPRDPEAERGIMDGLQRAPNAVYALVQTALVQDEALKQADARIGDLEEKLGMKPAARPTGFLDGMREAFLGPRATPSSGPVPSGQAQAPPAAAAPWQQGPIAPGGSFLSTAATAAAGVIGGSLLLDGIRSMTGHGHGAFGLADPAWGAQRDLASPLDNSGGGDLAHKAGVDDIGRAAQDSSRDPAGTGAEAADPAYSDVGDFDDGGADFGSGGDDDA
jgi:uncharacterized protein